mmetsp:Transcript_399/g.1178  ORF Transcript_399/g.1178 Transcript_399/m.1178 type:complete len:80 (-) Transcript_399:369-608(-)
MIIRMSVTEERYRERRDGVGESYAHDDGDEHDDDDDDGGDADFDADADADADRDDGADFGGTGSRSRDGAFAGGSIFPG